MKTVVVSAVGGDIGLPVARIVANAGYHVIGCDSSPNIASRAFIADVRLVPSADAPGYRDAIVRTCHETQADYLILNSENELRVCADLPTAVPATKVVALRKDLIATFGDKLATARWLAGHGFAAPASTTPRDALSLTLPIVFKRRAGSGGRDLIRARTVEERDQLLSLGDDFVAQEEIGDAEHEFTCGVFRAHGARRVVAIRRTLAGGITHRGEVVDDSAINALCGDIAEKADLFGSINVQLRLHCGRPMVFEINPRFSSTVLFRHMLGFTDVLWWLDALDGRAPRDFTPPAGTRIYRTGLEIVIGPDGTSQMAPL